MYSHNSEEQEQAMRFEVKPFQELQMWKGSFELIQSFKILFGVQKKT